MSAHKSRYMGYMAAPPITEASSTRSPTRVVGREAVAVEVCSETGPRGRKPSELAFGDRSQTLEELRAELESF